MVESPDGALYVSNHGANRVFDEDGTTYRPLGEVLRIDDGGDGDDDDKDDDDDDR